MIRTLIAAIENAGAVDAELSADPRIGLNHDVTRRDLTEADLSRIIESERDEVARAARHYRELGVTGEAEDLELRVQIADRYIG